MPAKFKQLEEFQKKLKKCQEDVPQLAIDTNKDIAAMFLSYTIDLTPVGQGTFDEEGNRIKQGGTLRRGWTAKTHAEAEKGSGAGENPQAYAESLDVNKNGTDYVLDVINPVEYALYVEKGYRQKKGQYVPALGKRLTGRVIPGRHMCRDGKNLTEQQVPKVINRNITKFMREHDLS